MAKNKGFFEGQIRAALVSRIPKTRVKETAWENGAVPEQGLFRLRF